MKAVTIHLDESIHSEFQLLARKSKRTASDLILEAMQAYRDRSKKTLIPWPIPPLLHPSERF